MFYWLGTDMWTSNTLQQLVRMSGLTRIKLDQSETAKNIFCFSTEAQKLSFRLVHSWREGPQEAYSAHTCTNTHRVTGSRHSTEDPIYKTFTADFISKGEVKNLNYYPVMMQRRWNNPHQHTQAYTHTLPVKVTQLHSCFASVMAPNKGAFWLSSVGIFITTSLTNILQPFLCLTQFSVDGKGFLTIREPQISAGQMTHRWTKQVYL